MPTPTQEELDEAWKLIHALRYHVNKGREAWKVFYDELISNGEGRITEDLDEVCAWLTDIRDGVDL